MVPYRLQEKPWVWAAAQALAPKKREWARNAAQVGWCRARSTGASDPAEIEELAEIKRLRAENRDLKEANEILKATSSFFAGELDLAAADLRVHRHDARRRARVEPICGALREQGLAVAPRSYRALKMLDAHARDRCDVAVLDKLRRVRCGGPKGRAIAGGPLRTTQGDRLAGPQRLPDHLKAHRRPASWAMSLPRNTNRPHTL